MEPIINIENSLFVGYVYANKDIYIGNNNDKFSILDLINDVKKLKEKYKKLKTHIKYMPNGEGYQEAMFNYNALLSYDAPLVSQEPLS